MHEYGTTSEQMASVAVATRRWAEQNPRAMMRDPITIDDVLSSRLIAWPIHLLECCLVTDGGGALVVVAAERAKDFPRKPVYLLGAGESTEHSMISQMHDFTESRAFKVSGDLAFKEAGIDRKDIDHAMFYDAFAHTPMFALEALGFVGKGESGPFFAEMRTAPGGEFPLNTNGGGLSYTHTGMYGMFAIQESVRQLRGTAAAQLDGIKTSIAHGVGGMFHAAGTLILTNDAGA
jgi:acetyl-CoA acetyltransferase